MRLRDVFAACLFIACLCVAAGAQAQVRAWLDRDRIEPAKPPRSTSPPTA
jgi:hypothetical protein